MEKIKDKFFLASMKTLTNIEIPSSNLLQIACCSIQEAACDSVNCLITVLQQLILAFSSCAEDVVSPSEENSTAPKEERIDPIEGRSVESRLSGMALFKNLR
jgi:hypothetical protein